MNARQMFDRAYQRTVTASGAPLDRDHADECWTQVAEFAPVVFDLAATRLNGASGFLPRPAEWLSACRSVQAERDMAELRGQERAAERYQQERTYHCVRCLDSGLEQRLECKAGQYCGPCGRSGQHIYDHTYCTPCSCRPTNPVWQADLQRRQHAVEVGRQKTRREAA